MYKATIVPRGASLGMVYTTKMTLFILSMYALQVSLLPEKDELSWTKKQLLAQIDVSMGGRVAEEITFGIENVTTGMSRQLCVTCCKSYYTTSEGTLYISLWQFACCHIFVFDITGASQDLQNATRIATAMVTKYAMSDAVSQHVCIPAIFLQFILCWRTKNLAPQLFKFV